MPRCFSLKWPISASLLFPKLPNLCLPSIKKPNMLGSPRDSTKRMVRCNGVCSGGLHAQKCTHPCGVGRVTVVQNVLYILHLKYNLSPIPPSFLIFRLWKCKILCPHFLASNQLICIELNAVHGQPYTRPFCT